MGSSFTSVKGLFAEAKPSIDSRITGEEARDEVELGNLKCPCKEKVGVTGEGRSEELDERERFKLYSKKSRDMSSPSIFLASTNNGSLRGIKSRILAQIGRRKTGLNSERREAFLHHGQRDWICFGSALIRGYAAASESWKGPNLFAQRETAVYSR